MLGSRFALCVAVAALVSIAPALANDVPELVERVDPGFPAKAQKAGLNGHVVLEVDVAPNGKVSAVRTSFVQPQGYGFDDEAKKAIRQWRYERSRTGFKNVQVVFNFTLPGTAPVVYGSDQSSYTGAGSEPPPLPIYKPTPHYPRSAYFDGIEGEVSVRMTISPQGLVTHAEVVAAKPTGCGFEAAALDAGRHYKFVPDGKTHENVIFTLGFTLPPDQRRNHSGAPCS